MSDKFVEAMVDPAFLDPKTPVSKVAVGKLIEAFVRSRLTCVDFNAKQVGVHVPFFEIGGVLLIFSENVVVNDIAFGTDVLRCVVLPSTGMTTIWLPRVSALVELHVAARGGSPVLIEYFNETGALAQSVQLPGASEPCVVASKAGGLRWVRLTGDSSEGLLYRICYAPQ